MKWPFDTRSSLALAIVGAFVTVIFVLIFFPPSGIPPEILAIVNMLVGALSAKFSTVVDFNFGSSQGSKDKDDAQNELVKNMAPAVVASALEAPAPPGSAGVFQPQQPK
jgi:ABC-type Fe3+-siderophore transport system permease subunit